jgi:hypothetical protein
MSVVALLANRPADTLEVFKERCWARALLVREGAMAFHEAVDGLQNAAEAYGLVERIGQDEIQRVLAEAFNQDISDLQSGVDDIVRRLELADPRDAWKHTGEAPPPASVRNSDIGGTPQVKPRPYKTPASTVAAFRYVLSLDDPEALKKWLSEHPNDAVFLKQLWRRNAFAR